MINNEFEYIGHALAQGAHHRSMPGTPATAQTWVRQVLTDVEAETDLGAVAELGYN
jgi:hypothetical protein